MIENTERQGFEPWFVRDETRFRDEPDRPLRHLSTLEDYINLLKYLNEIRYFNKTIDR